MDLIQEGVDCALRGGPVTDPDLVCRPDRADEILSDAPRRPIWPMLLLWPIRTDLAHQRCIGFRFPITNRLHVYTLHNGGQSVQTALSSALTFNHADVYCNAALAGLGIAAMPRAQAQRHFDNGELVEVLPQWQIESMPISIVYPYTCRLSVRGALICGLGG